MGWGAKGGGEDERMNPLGRVPVHPCTVLCCIGSSAGVGRSPPPRELCVARRRPSKKVPT